jgi:hypothetical protein
MPWDQLAWRIGLIALVAPLLLQLLRWSSDWLAVHTDTVKGLAILTAVATAFLLDWLPDNKLEAGNLIVLAFAQFGGIQFSYDWIISRISSWSTIRAAQAVAKEADE